MHCTCIASDRFTHTEIYMCNTFINTFYNLEFFTYVYEFIGSFFIHLIQLGFFKILACFTLHLGIDLYTPFVFPFSSVKTYMKENFQACSI